MKKQCIFLCLVLGIAFHSAAQTIDKSSFDKAVDYLNCKIVGYALQTQNQTIQANYKSTCNCDSSITGGAIKSFLLTNKLPETFKNLAAEIEGLKNCFDTLSGAGKALNFLSVAIYNDPAKFPAINAFQNKRTRGSLKADSSDYKSAKLTWEAALSGMLKGDTAEKAKFKLNDAADSSKNVDIPKDATSYKLEYSGVIAIGIFLALLCNALVLVVICLIVFNRKLRSRIKSVFEKRTNTLGSDSTALQKGHDNLMNPSIEERVKKLESQIQTGLESFRTQVKSYVSYGNKGKQGGRSSERDWVLEKINEGISTFRVSSTFNNISQNNASLANRIKSAEDKMNLLFERMTQIENKVTTGEGKNMRLPTDNFETTVPTGSTQTASLNYPPTTPPGPFKLAEISKQAEVFFLSTPNADGYFSESDASINYKEGASVYVFTKIASNRAKFQIDGRETSVRLALQFPDKIIDPVCEAQSAFNPKTKRIVTETPGEAELIDGRWVVSKSQKAKIHYES